ncbi:hypothetical protein LCGC14_2414590 [marine sediment metagenome]|uniref:Uncharacterized protein n=1 Tax=marine sediment metagenome TaxID=412755 RepID=A0A0F9BRH5_9ZZZZ
MTDQELQQRLNSSKTQAKGKAILALHRAIAYLDDDDSKTAAIREMLWAIDCLDGHRPLRYSENAKHLHKESIR